MGKQINLVISFLTAVFMLISTAYAFSPNIPLETLKAAEETAEKTDVKPISTQSEIVRVGIGNQSFSNYAYSSAGIYATTPVDIYFDGVWQKQVPASTNINIKITPDALLELSTDTGENLGQHSGVIKFTTSGGLIGIKNLKRAGNPAMYRGYFEIIKTPNEKQFNIVNKIPVEQYLRGVVPNEMPVSFGLEALKAQSVAARNYVLSPRIKSSPNYDVVDSVASQVYYGANTEKPLSDRAVAETEGVVALYDWDLILALYSSTAGGYTESYSNAFSDPQSGNFPSAEKPYLKAKPDMLSQEKLHSEADAEEFYKNSKDAYDIRSPYYRWTRDWTAEELKEQLQNTLSTQSSTGFIKPAFNKDDILDDIIDLRVKRRGDSGKIIELELITKTQEFKIFKELVIRRTFTNNGKALPSANVVFEKVKDEDGNLISIKAYGGGYGHGVGMSQFGAGFMGSELKLPYYKILQHYYSGITLGTKPVIVSSEKSQNSVVQTFYATNKQAEIVIDNKFQMNSLNVTINGQEYSFKLPTSFFGGNRCCRINISDYINKGKNTIVFNYPLSENGHKAIRLFVELVEKDDRNNIWER